MSKSVVEDDFFIKTIDEETLNKLYRATYRNFLPEAVHMYLFNNDVALRDIEKIYLKTDIFNGHAAKFVLNIMGINTAKKHSGYFFGQDVRSVAEKLIRSGEICQVNIGDALLDYLAIERAREDVSTDVNEKN